MMSDWDGLAVTEVGDGPGVLWLHGYTMCSEVWRPVWERMPGWRHVGLDLPWHGASRGLRDRETLAMLADSIVAHTASSSVSHVVALSFGTVLATEMAVRHPDAYDSWTLAAPSLAGMPHEPAVTRRYLDLYSMYRRFGAGPHMTQLWMASPPAIFAGINDRPEARERMRHVVDKHPWHELASDGMRRLVTRAQVPDDLAAAQAPIAVIVGGQDLLTHKACARAIALSAPTASMTTMPRCGHLPLLEEPDSGASLIARHLTTSVIR
jgi:2-succinyl-6-hydroxy-2,4-cyclohexadiene-1-carboxylate synthase